MKTLINIEPLMMEFACRTNSKNCCWAFLQWEVESKLRRIICTEYVFWNDSVRELCMEIIEKLWRENILSHLPSDCLSMSPNIKVSAAYPLETLVNYHGNLMSDFMKVCNHHCHYGAAGFYNNGLQSTSSLSSDSSDTQTHLPVQSDTTTATDPSTIITAGGIPIGTDIHLRTAG